MLLPNLNGKPQVAAAIDSRHLAAHLCRSWQQEAHHCRGDDITTFSELLEMELSVAQGWPRLRCTLRPERVDAAAVMLADGITRQRFKSNPRLYALWRSQLTSTEALVDARDELLFEAGLLQNLGTPSQPGSAMHLRGLMAEAIWREVVSEIDVGLGIPLCVEGHGWSVTDPGGDGLSVYETADGGFCFRLWEIKHHGTDDPVRRTVNDACRQVRTRSMSYLSRFSNIAQRITDNDDLASFFGRIAELWVDRDPAAGVGISVGTNSNANAFRCFGRVPGYFSLDLDQHQAHLYLMDDFAELARQVREQIWRGCGLWIEP